MLGNLKLPKKETNVTAPGADILLGFGDARSSETPIINNQGVISPSSMILLGDYSAQYFETPQKFNHVVTAPSDQILLGSDPLKCQHKNRTHRQGQKIPPPRKDYLCFQMVGKPAHSAQCSDSRTLTKMIDLILGI